MRIFFPFWTEADVFSVYNILIISTDILNLSLFKFLLETPLKKIDIFYFDNIKLAPWFLKQDFKVILKSTLLSNEVDRGGFGGDGEWVGLNSPGASRFKQLLIQVTRQACWCDPY